MDKLKMHSPDLSQQNIEKIRALFPNCVTEAQNSDGSIKLAIDFDQLKQELSDSLVEGPQERYHLNWPGKREALLTANAPIAKTLRPCRAESVDFDTTKNLFIEGDNLEALKLLQDTYLDKIKMIFIDPPYNTGSDFIYNDNFAEDSDSYLKKSEQVDTYGRALSANLQSSGRFHSDWNSFIYARLKIARSLLREDGVIFIAIDDNEQFNLRSICNEIFGSDNFIATIIWQHSVQPKGYTDIFSVHHNYILMFQKSDKFNLHPLERTDEDNKAYGNPDNDPRGLWRAGDVRNALYRPNLKYDLTTPSGKIITPPENGWRWSKDTMQQKIKSGEIVFKDNESKIIRKIYLDTLEGRAPETIWFGKDAGTTREGSKEIKEDFEGDAPFDTTKPIALIKRMAKIAGVEKEDWILDFFAGSGTTGVACLKENISNFILVQIQEPIDETKPHGKVAKKLGLNTISEITLRRLTKACSTAKAQKYSSGFRMLKVDSSNMSDVYYSSDNLSQGSLNLLIDNIKEDRTNEDLLFQVLLDWGVDLTLPIRSEQIVGKQVFFVNDTALIACFDAQISEELVSNLATLQPLRVIFRDDSFASDSVKINAEQIFRQLSPHTEIKTI